MTEQGLHNAIKQAIQRQDKSGLEATEAATIRVIKVLHSLGYRRAEEMAEQEIKELADMLVLYYRNEESTLEIARAILEKGYRKVEKMELLTKEEREAVK